MMALNWSCMSHYGNYLLLITLSLFIVFEDSGELTAFVELASISAGENTMDIDKVCCFRDAVSAAAPIIYQLSEKSGIEELLKAIAQLEQALGSDSTLVDKLVSLTMPKRLSGLLHYKARDVLVSCFYLQTCPRTKVMNKKRKQQLRKETNNKHRQNSQSRDW